MKVLVLLVCFFVLSPAHALYLSKYSPQGEDVDPGAEITLEFEADIATFGMSQEVKKEQTNKVTITPKVNCLWRYEGTRVLKCKPKDKLTPDTQYQVKVEDGFTGVKVDDRLSYDQPFNFKTNALAIRGYRLAWTETGVTGVMNLNYQVKTENLSGTIQCGDKNTPVKVSATEENKTQILSFTANAGVLTDESCSFYFDKAIALKNFPVSSLPDQKVIVSRALTVAEGAGFGADLLVFCEKLQYQRTKLISTGIPSIGCEFSDRLQIETGADIKHKIPVSVSPSEGIKVENEVGMGAVYVSGFKPGQSYVINVAKSVHPKLKKDIQVLFSAYLSPPLLGNKKPYGVIEKDGPWKIPVSAMNIRSLALEYEFLTKPEELGQITNFQDEGRMFPKSVDIPLKLPPNENHLMPLEFTNVAAKEKFTAGLFTGKVSIKDVDPPYRKANDELVKEEWDRKNRSQFQFAFLVTDIGLHLKSGETGAFIWATGLREGKPLSGVKLTVYQGGKIVGEGETNRDGTAWIKGVNRSAGIYAVVARKGDDISFLSTDWFWSRGISPYDFNLVNYYEEESDAKGLVADVVSERPLYLPGEKVELKLFVREDGANGMDLRPVGEKLQVTIHDSRGEEILKTTAALNKYGTLAISHKLEPKAVTGSYTVYVSAGKLSASFPNAFQVHEFRKPEIKVSMTEDPANYSGKVTYYSGGEMAKASGEVAVIFKAKAYKPTDPQLKNMTFPEEVGGRYYEWESYYDRGSYPEVLSREEIVTDEKGVFTVEKASILSSIKKHGVLTVEGIFADSAGGKVAGRLSTLINPYKYIPGIELGKWYYTAGEKVNPRVAVVDSTGKQAVGVKMELAVKRITYSYERRLGSGNYFYYDYRKEEKDVKKCKFTTAADLRSCDVTMKEAGTYSFAVKAEGESELTPAVTETWVMKEGEFFSWGVENHDRINISTESSSLKLGDTFRMMALAPFADGEALITFEREGIIHSEQVSFKGNVVQYEKKIDDEKFIPGFYASIVIVKGRSSDKVEGEVDLGRPLFKIGYARVDVANLPKRLSVEVTPSRATAKPGEMMEATVRVKDYKGRGTASELAIAVVDDSLLSLTGNYKANYDILDTFYSLRRSKFWNYQTLTQLIGRRTYGKKGVNPGGGGGSEIRSDLRNTALWVAQVETDGSGEHTFKFKLPDNLTTWKIIAVSVDANHRFGFGEGEFLATKPLTVEPSLPNFLVEGDKFRAQVNIANRSGEAQDVTVGVSAKGLTAEVAEQKVALKNGGRSPVIFPMTAQSVESAELTMKASAAKHSDALKVTLPVERNAISHVAFSTGFVEGKEVSHPVSLPKDARKDSLSLSVEYSHTALNGLDEVFKYVLHYPYGCWEQRLSAAYFLVQYEAFKDHISYRFPETEGKIRDAVQKLLDLAPDYQGANGGMRYYPGGEDWSDGYLSIFTGYSFVLMKKMGYKINKDVERKLITYLKSLLSEDKTWNDYYSSQSKNSNKALLLTVLSGLGEKNLSAAGSKLYAERNGLDIMGLSFLGGYLQSAKGFEKEAENVFHRLDSLKVVSGNRIHFKESVATNDEWKWWNYTDTRSQCAALQNLVPFTNDRLMAGSVVREILSRMRDGHWYNTQENMYCFEGLRRFVEKFEAKNQDGELTVRIDEKEIDKEPSKKLNVRTVALGSKELDPAMKKITLEPKGKAELYYSTFLRFETPYQQRAPVDKGFSLRKSIYLVKDGKLTELKGDRFTVKKGDTLKINLTVTTSAPRYQVMLNDRLAACLEPINMALATGSQADAADTEATEDEKKKNPWFVGEGFEYVDLRLNAAQFYAKKLEKGTFNVTYMVQVRTAGEFSMPESTVEEMYYPDIRGTFSGKKITVNE